MRHHPAERSFARGRDGGSPARRRWRVSLLQSLRSRHRRTRFRRIGGSARRADFALMGGAVGRITGRMTAGGAPVGDGLFLGMAGVADLTDAPLLETGRGETIRLRTPNRTGVPHATRLPGQRLREATGGAGGFRRGPCREALLVNPREIREVAFAENSGDWLVRRHMLQSRAAGAKTWPRVA